MLHLDSFDSQQLSVYHVEPLEHLPVGSFSYLIAFFVLNATSTVVDLLILKRDLFVNVSIVRLSLLLNHRRKLLGLLVLI